MQKTWYKKATSLPKCHSSKFSHTFQFNFDRRQLLNIYQNADRKNNVSKVICLQKFTAILKRFLFAGYFCWLLSGPWCALVPLPLWSGRSKLNRRICWTQMQQTSGIVGVRYENLMHMNLWPKRLVLMQSGYSNCYSAWVIGASLSTQNAISYLTENAIVTTNVSSENVILS